MALQDRDYALVIGFNHYPHYGAGGRSLKGAIRDARGFAEWLGDSTIGGSLPAANIRLIESTDNPLGPDQRDIDRALQAIAHQARNTGARRFYFYFSGHGHVSGEVHHDVALCLPHWSRDFRNAALSSSKYLDYLLKCTEFEEIVLLLDCCRVKQVAAIGKRSDLECPVPVGGQRRLLIAYASEFLKPAFEATTPRGEIDADHEGSAAEEDEVRGHFTEALLAGLRAGAAGAQGGVTARALKRYLEMNVERVAEADQHVQKPQVALDMSEAAAEEMIFGSALPVANVEITFTQQRQGIIELEGPTAEVLKRDDAGSGPWRLRLDKGLYLIREVASGEERPLRFIPREVVTHVEF